MFDHPAFDGHERLVMHSDSGSGLKAIIAVHDSTLGPAAGGCRRWQYQSSEQALGDALRLSQGMTFKNALADLPLGGGKAVVLADGPATRDQWLAFAKLVDSMGGQYITAEDVGSRQADMALVARCTQFVSGVGQDPSPYTARGVFEGMKTAVRVMMDRELAGLRVAVQGLGNVGLRLCGLLSGAGARLVVADIDRRRCDEARCRFAADVVGVDDIATAPADVFSPCALGGVIGVQEAERVSCHVIAGAANNQLTDPAVARILMERGVLYAPDYVINAGGIIQVAAEYLGRDQSWVDARIAEIGPRLADIAARAHADRIPTAEVAEAMARDKIGRSQNSAGCGRRRGRAVATGAA